MGNVLNRIRDRAAILAVDPEQEALENRAINGLVIIRDSYERHLVAQATFELDVQLGRQSFFWPLVQREFPSIFSICKWDASVAPVRLKSSDGLNDEQRAKLQREAKCREYIESVHGDEIRRTAAAFHAPSPLLETLKKQHEAQIRKDLDRAIGGIGVSPREWMPKGTFALMPASELAAFERQLQDKHNARMNAKFEWVSKPVVAKLDEIKADVDRATRRAEQEQKIRERQDERLRADALHIAEMTVKKGTVHSMAPMNAYQRRIVHMAVERVPGVRTESRGEEPRRAVWFLPKEPRMTVDALARLLFDTDPRVVALVMHVADSPEKRPAMLEKAWKRADGAGFPKVKEEWKWKQECYERAHKMMASMGMK